jgi:hypothetical protein
MRDTREGEVLRYNTYNMNTSYCAGDVHFTERFLKKTRRYYYDGQEIRLWDIDLCSHLEP